MATLHLKVRDSPALNKSIGTISPTLLAQLMSLNDILVVLRIFLTFSLLLHLLVGDLWSVIFFYCDIYFAGLESNPQYLQGMPVYTEDNWRYTYMDDS